MINFARVLIVDDDAELCALLREFLTRERFDVEFAHDGDSGLKRVLGERFDLVVLDLMLPGMDGIEVLRRLRAVSRVPVLLLTARGEDEDRIQGLNAGADDYLAKPFNPRELVARIRAVLRRTAPAPASLEVNGVVLDPGMRDVFCDGQPVELTTLEFDILEILMRSPGRVVSRDTLMERMYKRKATPFDRSIDMHVSHLRRKLETTRKLIKTVRGVGYQFARSAKEAAESAAS
jgi:two-component system response regulator CpxR